MVFELDRLSSEALSFLGDWLNWTQEHRPEETLIHKTQNWREMEMKGEWVFWEGSKRKRVVEYELKMDFDWLEREGVGGSYSVIRLWKDECPGLYLLGGAFVRKTGKTNRR